MEMRPYIALHDRGLVPRRVDSTTEVRAAEALAIKRAAQGSVPEGLVLADFWETQGHLWVSICQPSAFFWDPLGKYNPIKVTISGGFLTKFAHNF